LSIDDDRRRFGAELMERLVSRGGMSLKGIESF